MMNVQETAATLMAQAAKWPQVETRTVTFENAGSTLSGTLYLPEELRSASLPVVVVTGAWTTVQGQMPSVYAREMAARGFAALTFDFRGWGASDDLANGRRFIESPAEKTSDIRAALAFASTLPDADKVLGLGICASSGYMVDAVAGNAQVAGIGLIAPWLHNREIVEKVYGGAEGVAGLIEVSRAAEAAGGEIIPAAGPEGAEVVLMPIGGYYVDAGLNITTLSDGEVDFPNGIDVVDPTGFVAHEPPRISEVKSTGGPINCDVIRPTQPVALIVVRNALDQVTICVQMHEAALRSLFRPHATFHDNMGAVGQDLMTVRHLYFVRPDGRFPVWQNGKDLVAESIRKIEHALTVKDEAFTKIRSPCK